MRLRPWDNPVTGVIILGILFIAALVAETRLGRGLVCAFGRVRLFWNERQVAREGRDGYTFV